MTRKKYILYLLITIFWAVLSIKFSYSFPNYLYESGLLSRYFLFNLRDVIELSLFADIILLFAVLYRRGDLLGIPKNKLLPA